MRVEIAQAAQRDLDQIEAHIAEKNPDAASRMHARLSKACLTLARMPRRYVWDERIRLHRRSVGAYLIFYRATERVEIVRVIHGARDWLALLSEGD